LTPRALPAAPLLGCTAGKALQTRSGRSIQSLGPATSMAAIWDTTRLPELRELVRIAREYLSGEVHFSVVCSAAGALRDSVHLYASDRALKNYAQDWCDMATRMYPEFAQGIEPITEDEFRTWIKSQLAVFDASTS